MTEQKPDETPSLQENRGMNAWRLSSAEQAIADSNRAVGLLLKQADQLMAEDDFAKSSDKLERLVRIEPRFAQAWSRLAWMALKDGDAKRSRQLAQRSNSFSRGNTYLKILNWNFIQKAGELLNDTGIVEQAQQMIKKLENN